jgi:hypothetical protein
VGSPERIEDLPFAVGESPFHTKGHVYLGAAAFYDQRVDGGFAAVRDQLEPTVKPFFARTLLASGLYDVLPILPLSRTAARLCGMDHPAFVRENGRWIAERDIRGIYSLLLMVTSPETVALRLPKASMRYFDFGQAESRMIDKRECEATQTGVPAILASWFTAAVEGFAALALEKAGGRNPRIVVQPPQPQGKGHGVDLVTSRFRMLWG